MEVIYCDEDKREAHNNLNKKSLGAYPGSVITIDQNRYLESIEFPSLKEIYKGSIVLVKNPKLCIEKINFDDLGVKDKYGGVIDCDSEVNPSSKNSIKRWYNSICSGNNNFKNSSAICNYHCPRTIIEESNLLL